MSREEGKSLGSIPKEEREVERRRQFLATGGGGMIAAILASSVPNRANAQEFDRSTMEALIQKNREIEQELSNDPSAAQRFMSDPASYLLEKGIDLPPDAVPSAEQLQHQFEAMQRQAGGESAVAVCAVVV